MEKYITSATYHLKIISPGVSWGISIILNADLIPNSIIKDEYWKIVDEIYLDNRTKIKFPDQDKYYLIKGIFDFKEHIYKSIPEGKNFVIRLNEIILGLADFQPEGFYFAVVGWLSMLIKFKSPPVNFRFDKNRNIYLFDISLIQ